MKRKVQKKEIVKIIAFIIGACLFLLLVYGRIIGLRNNKIYFDETIDTQFGVVYSYRESLKVFSEIKKMATEEDKIIAATDLVNKGMAHFWKKEGAEVKEYNIRIPFRRNYILYVVSAFLPEYQQYEYYDWRKALERGVGLCSQHAIALQIMLKELNIHSNVVGLAGHVVVQVEIDNDYWILDPDYGVIVKHSLSTIEQKPAIIQEDYSKAGYDEEKISILSVIYEKEGNIVYENDSRGITNYPNPSIKRRSFVRKTTLFISWAIPIILMAPSLLTISEKIKKNVWNSRKNTIQK